MHRIFIAITLSKILQERILAWEQSYRNLPVRWLFGKNLHITLVPPWHTDKWEGVSEKLKAVKAESFAVNFHHVTFGPDSKVPRLIWAEGNRNSKIENLKFKIEQVLGVQTESGPFKLHATLARFRPEDFPRFPIKHFSETVGWREEIKSFVLMESHLYPQGADYEILEEFPLQLS